MDGPDKERENTISQIDLAIGQGFHVEIDLWYENEKWWLGHDSPSTPVDTKWLEEIDQGIGGLSRAWIHAKNIDALYRLRSMEWPGHYFYHQNDDVVLTSTGYLWTYPGRKITSYSIGVMPEWVDLLDRIGEIEAFGWCSDYVHRLRGK